MKSLLLAAAITGLAFTSAHADDAAKKNPVAPDKATVTEKIGENVPTMTKEGEPAAKSTAPDSQTYTDKVGDAVPTMKAPKTE